MKSITKDDDDPYNCSTEYETEEDAFCSGDGDDDDAISNANHKLKGRLCVWYIVIKTNVFLELFDCVRTQLVICKFITLFFEIS